jgi:hypothetical protein
MKNGRMTNLAGDVVEADTQEFAEELARLHKTGEWNPTALDLPASQWEFQVTNPVNYLSEFRDKMFNAFYTKPDVAMARAPLYRSMAAKEYRRLTSLGWRHDRAIEGAQAFAARRVSDMLYRIGETSMAHHWLRNIAPFFPAFQELTTTWLYRVPKSMGGGFYTLGAARLARKADIFLDFFKNMGIVERDENGELYVSVPVLGSLVSAITGSPVPLRARASLTSFTGVLPDPFSGIKGLLPGLGAPSSAILTTAANHWDGVVDDLADYLMQFGREVSLGPSAIDRLAMAAGIEPFWTFGSPDFQKTIKNYAIDDAIRVEMVKNPPPTRNEGEKDAAYNKRYTAWSEGVLQKAENRASIQYLVRGVSSMILPFSVTYDTDYEHEMQRIWTTLSTLPDGGGDLASPLIDAFKATYPEAVWYLNGKSINLGEKRSFTRTDAFIQEWTDQNRASFTPEEYLRWSVGMNSYSIYREKLDRAYQALGDTPADVLLNGFEKFDTIAPIKKEWEDYLTWSETVVEGEERSFHTLFNIWQKARDNRPEIDLTRKQEASRVSRGKPQPSSVASIGRNQAVTSARASVGGGTTSESLTGTRSRSCMTRSPTWTIRSRRRRSTRRFVLSPTTRSTRFTTGRRCQPLSRSISTT